MVEACAGVRQVGKGKRLARRTQRESARKAHESADMERDKRKSVPRMPRAPSHEEGEGLTKEGEGLAAAGCAGDRKVGKGR